MNVKGTRSSRNRANKNKTKRNSKRTSSNKKTKSLTRRLGSTIKKFKKTIGKYKKPKIKPKQKTKPKKNTQKSAKNTKSTPKKGTQKGKNAKLSVSSANSANKNKAKSKGKTKNNTSKKLASSFYFNNNSIANKNATYKGKMPLKELYLTQKKSKKNTTKGQKAKKSTSVSKTTNNKSNSKRQSKKTAGNNTSKKIKSSLYLSSLYLNNPLHGKNAKNQNAKKMTNATNSKLANSKGKNSFMYGPLLGNNIQTTQDKTNQAITDLTKAARSLNGNSKKGTTKLLSQIEALQKSIIRTNGNLTASAKRASSAKVDIQSQISSFSRGIGEKLKFNSIGGLLEQAEELEAISNGTHDEYKKKKEEKAINNLKKQAQNIKLTDKKSKDNHDVYHQIKKESKKSIFGLNYINPKDVKLPPIKLSSDKHTVNYQYPGYNVQSAYTQNISQSKYYRNYVDTREKDIREKGYTNSTGAKPIIYSRDDNYVDYGAFAVAKRFESLFDTTLYLTSLGTFGLGISPKVAQKIININITEIALKNEEKRKNHKRTSEDIMKFNVTQGATDFFAPKAATAIVGPAAIPIYSFGVNTGAMLEGLGSSNNINIDNWGDMVKVGVGAISYGAVSALYYDRGVEFARSKLIGLTKKYENNILMKTIGYPMVASGAAGKTVTSSIVEYMVTGEVTSTASDFGNNTTADTVMVILYNLSEF